MNFAGTDRFALARIAVQESTTVEGLIRTCRGRGLGWAQFQEKARATIKSVLGNSAYDSLRALMLRYKRKANSEFYQ
jgi:hypothetical protein